MLQDIPFDELELRLEAYNQKLIDELKQYGRSVPCTLRVTPPLHGRVWKAMNEFVFISDIDYTVSTVKEYNGQRYR